MKEVDILHTGLNQGSVNSYFFIDMFQVIFANCSQIGIFPINFTLAESQKCSWLLHATWTQREEKLDWKEIVMLSDIKMS